MALTSVEDLDRISKSLEKMAANKDVNVERAKRYLYRLRDTQITLAVLQKTGLGIVINKLRRATEDEDIVSVARELIKSWKKLLPEADDVESQSQRLSGEAVESRREGKTYARTGNVDVASSRTEKDTPNSSPDVVAAQRRLAEEPSSENSSVCREDGERQPKMARLSSSEEMQHQVLFGAMRVHATTDPMRLKCREMLKNAMEGGVGADVDLPQDSFDTEYLAAELESAIFKEFLRSDDSKYKNRVRSRVLNLKDQKNPQLRENLLLGSLRPERLAKMTAEEMASNEMRELRERYTKQAIDDYQLAVTSGTKTSLITCKRCKGNSCMYNQVQTRSADEPMTTFVWCNDCGLRWKFC